jgi:hypothetical protein
VERATSDDPGVEAGDLLVGVFIEEAEEDPPLRAWERDHEAMCRELYRDLAERVPEARYLEFWFGGDTGHQGRTRQQLLCPPDDPATPGLHRWLGPRTGPRPSQRTPDATTWRAIAGARTDQPGTLPRAKP